MRQMHMTSSCRRCVASPHQAPLRKKFVKPVRWQTPRIDKDVSFLKPAAVTYLTSVGIICSTAANMQ